VASTPKSARFQDSTDLSPFTSNISHSSRNFPLGGIIIPSSETGRATDIGGFRIPGADETGVETTTFPGGVAGEGHELLPEADFAFDEEGNLLDFDTGVIPMYDEMGSRLPSITGSGRMMMEGSGEQVSTQKLLADNNTY
jgi:hypothetical protein